MLDFSIVFVDVICFFVGFAFGDLPSVTFLRVLRLLRLSRVFHILASNPELYVMMEGLMGAVKSIFWGSCFLCVGLLICGIMAVEFIHPIADSELCYTSERCTQPFESVFQAMCTLVQTIIIGDSWGIMYAHLFAQHRWTFPCIILVFLTLNFGIMNLIFAVIVDSAAQARVANTREMAQLKDNAFQRYKHKLFKLCKEMDKDGSQNLSWEELQSGYETNMDFQRTLRAMDIQQDDLVAVFSILDEDQSGDVAYAEFVEQLYKMKSNDSHTMLVFIKHYVTELRKKMSEELTIMKSHIVTGVQQLHIKVEEELLLIKEDMSLHVSALEAADRRIEATIENNTKLVEEELIKGDIAHRAQFIGSPKGMHVQALSSSEPVMLASEAKAAASWSGIQLQVGTEHIAQALDDLRRNCDNSVEILAKLRNSPPALNRDSASQLRNVAKMCEVGGTSAEVGQPGANLTSNSTWPSKGCCTDLRRAQSGPGIDPRL